MSDRDLVLEDILRSARRAGGSRELLNCVLRTLRQHLGATWGTVWLFDRDSDTWYIACSVGLSGDAKELRFPRGSALPCRVGERGVSLRIGDLDKNKDFQRFHPVHYRMRSALYLPMGMGRHPLGVVGLYSDVKHAFDAEDESFGSLVAGYVGFVVACFLLRDQRERLAVLDERDRLAQNLHDGMLQTLSTLRLYASELESSLAADAPGDARLMVSNLSREVDEAIEEVRASIAALRVVDVFENVEEAIRRSCIRLRSAGVDSSADVQVAKLAPEVSDALARVVREAANNILKHSQATRCNIALGETSDDVVLVIEDNGVGPPPQGLEQPNGVHLGLQLLRERVGQLGGSIASGPARERGFRLECRVPQGARS